MWSDIVMQLHLNIVQCELRMKILLGGTIWKCVLLKKKNQMSLNHHLLISYI